MIVQVTKLAGQSIDDGQTRNRRATPAIPKPMAWVDMMSKIWKPHLKVVQVRQVSGVVELMYLLEVLVIENFLGQQNVNSITEGCASGGHNCNNSMFLDIKGPRVQVETKAHDVMFLVGEDLCHADAESASSA